MKTSRCDEAVSLPVGTYVVRATLPSGERATDVVTIEEGGAQERRLAAPEPDSPRARDARPGAAPGRPRRGVTRGVERAWYVRFWEAVPGQPLEPAQPSVELEDGDEAALRISPSGIGLLRAQFAVPGSVPLNVALPVYGMTSVQSCRVAVTVEGTTIAADVTLPDNPRADTVARYLQTGNLREAADLLGNAESLLAQKMADPFAAALGGYALGARAGSTCCTAGHGTCPPGSLGSRRRCHRRRGGSARGRPRVGGARAPRQRPARNPVFTDGCAILMSRLREYAAAAKPRPA